MAEEKVGPWVRASAIGLALLGLIQIGLGGYLNMGYTPTPEGAPESMRAVRDLGLPEFLQHVHYWGSAWLIVHGFVHIVGLLVSGAYLRVSKGAWLGAVGLFGTSFAMQVTGNLLPFDRHDVQTAVAEGNIAAGVPGLGTFISTLMLNGEKFGPNTLFAWHKIHLCLLLPLIVSILMVGIPPRNRERAKGFVRFVWLVPLVAVAALALALPSPWGASATSIDFVLADARPSWYTWPMHGALNAFESISGGLGWIGAGVLPLLFGGLLLFAPWLGAKRDRLVRGAFVVFVLGFGAMGALFGGSPAPAWGHQEVPDFKADASQAKPIDERLARYGFRMAVQNCAICHGKDLKGADGRPDLTTQFRRHADAAYFERFIRDPKAAKPGSTMPGQSHLPAEEIAAMAEWLRQPKP